MFRESRQLVPTFDVFVSYRRSDRTFVKRSILPLLAKHGLRVFVDFGQDGKGLPTSEFLRRGQENSRWTLAVLTPAYLTSPFTDFELRQALITRRLVPVLAGSCRLPPGIAKASVIDFSTLRRRRQNASTLLRWLQRPALPDRSPDVRLPESIQRSTQGYWNDFQRAVRESELQEAFELLYTHLFPLLHYTFGSYVDSADAILTLLTRASSEGFEFTPPDARASLPLTGTLVPRHRSEEDPRAWMLTALGVTFRALWSPGHAAACFRRARTLYRRRDVQHGVIANTINLADVLWEQSRFVEVSRELTAALRAARKTTDTRLAAIVHQDLGLRLAYHARWRESALHLREARRLAGNDRHRQAIIWAHAARRLLLLARWQNAESAAKTAPRNRTAAMALRAAKKSAALHRAGNISRHTVRALWLQGAAHAGLGQHEEALMRLNRARDLCSALAASEFEADICLDLARCHHDRGETNAASSLALWSLDAARRSGRDLQVIDSRLFLAALSLRGQRRRQARRELRAVIDCIGRQSPPFRYEVALREASALLRDCS